jgi:hypothetical protein
LNNGVSLPWDLQLLLQNLKRPNDPAINIVGLDVAVFGFQLQTKRVEVWKGSAHPSHFAIVDKEIKQTLVFLIIHTSKIESTFPETVGGALVCMLICQGIGSRAALEIKSCSQSLVAQRGRLAHQAHSDLFFFFNKLVTVFVPCLGLCLAIITFCPGFRWQDLMLSSAMSTSTESLAFVAS